MRVAFDTLPDDARAWVFAVNRPLTATETDTLLAAVDAFLDEWHAHGEPLRAGRDWQQGRFLMIAADEHSAAPSGCSIDALLGILKTLEHDLGLRLTDHAEVVYRTPDGSIAQTDRPTFARLARAGTVTLETPVFDTTLVRKADLASRLEVPARDAWHRRAFWRPTRA